MIGTLSRADDAVRFRYTEKGARQRDVLRQLEQDSGRKRSAIVADLDAQINVGHDQYRRYLRGDTPLRWDQIDVFAKALNTTKAELSRALGLLDDDPDPVLRARAAEAVGPGIAPEMGATLDDIARELGKHDPKLQDDLLRQMRDVISTQPAPTQS